MMRARYTPGTVHLLVAGGRAVVLPSTAGAAGIGGVWAALTGEGDLDAALAVFDQHAVIGSDGSVADGALALNTVASDDGAGELRVSAQLVWGAKKPWLPLETGVVRAAAFELVIEPDDDGAVPVVASSETGADARADAAEAVAEPGGASVPAGAGAPDGAEPTEEAEEHAAGLPGAVVIGAAGVAAGAGLAAAGAPAAGHPAPTDDDGAAAERQADPLMKEPNAAEPTPTVPIAAAVLGDHDGATMLPGEVAAERAEPPAGGKPLGDHDGETRLPGEVDDIRAEALGDHDGQTKLPDEIAELFGETGDLPVTTDGADRFGNTEAISAPMAPAISAEEAAAGTIVPRVVLSNGTEARLDRPVLIGRRPRSVRSVGEDVPHLVTVESPMHDISRNHLEIKIEDDAAIATDLNSTNGTLLHRDGEAHRLHPGERTLLIEGDTLDLGEGITVSFQGLP
ncbi:FHA domain-containing protein [Microbacterium halophytorum]|uniref:FHA domain-containing protein n=1 Tax=Microbacterium halophytorum TaxID=2067568 RepID=UPI001E64F866|nr:FHA domain-containing protein [Microbacterium halophytorum]